MNMNLKLNLNPRELVKAVQPYLGYVVAIVAVGLFGYAGWVINAAFNVQPNPDGLSDKPAARVTFDAETVKLLKNLNVVPGKVEPTDIGKSDPFSN